ncbi:MAG: GNAT family N-acetyltransferase [Oscillospiraceae bacterium]|nr:GNAT family N-acetyltransferase [Oscillospiraceae bacterium]
MTADLRTLWQEAFGDPDDFINLFFTVGYSPKRCHCIKENGVPVSALYWFDCELSGRKLAYIYGVATLKSHRGKGLAGQLLRETHEILRNQGYAGAILVPSGAALFDFYRQFGYQTATTVTKFSCDAGDSPVAIRKISPEEYSRLCSHFLPEGGVKQGNDALAFLAGYCDFYAGEDFLLVCKASPEGLWAQELLGNTQAAPGILRALGFSKGRFRVPGADRNFAMWLPLQEDCPQPGWFGRALD